jgi:hypothetical protein
MNIYRSNYIKYWQNFNPNYTIPKGYHVHHILPQSCGGSDDAKNLIALHPDDHVAIHKNRGDKWMNKEFSSILIKGRTNCPCKETTKEKIRASLTGFKHSDEVNATKGLKGDKNTFARPEVKAKIKAMIAARPEVTCPHCGKVGQHAAMARWHFKNCKEIR